MMNSIRILGFDKNRGVRWLETENEISKKKMK